MAKSPGLATTKGFVLPNFSFIHDYKQDWKQVGDHWQFVGTSVTLQVRPEMFLPSDLPRPVVAIIRKHEDLHVADAKKIVERTLPDKLRADPAFKHYFIDRTPIGAGTYNQMVPGGIEGVVERIFTGLWNDSVRALDTPANYKAVADQVDAAMAKLHR